MNEGTPTYDRVTGEKNIATPPEPATWWHHLKRAFVPRRELPRGPVLYPGMRNVRVAEGVSPDGGADTLYPDPVRPTLFNTRDSWRPIVTFHGLWDYWSDPAFRTVSYSEAPFVAIPAGFMETDPIRKNIRKPQALPLGAYFEIAPDTYHTEPF